VIRPGPVLQHRPAQTDSARRVFGQSLGRDRARRRVAVPADRCHLPSPASTRCTCSCHPVCNAPSWRPDAGIARATAARPPPPQGAAVGRSLPTSCHLRSTRRSCNRRPCTLPPRYRFGGEAVHSFSHSYRQAPATLLELAIATFPRPPSTAASGAPPSPSTPPVASPELGGAHQPQQPSQRQPADSLTGAPLCPTAIAAASPPR
jgi:hypothetical protein